MDNTFNYISNNIEETSFLAGKLTEALKKSGGLVCLYGDIGAGKTALTILCGKFLNIKEKITSPSFVILNEYHSGDKDLYHFDLYRLENEGLKSITDELRTYSQDKNALTFVEWAEFSEDELNIDRLEINIKYKGDTKREFIFKNIGLFQNEAFENLKKELNNEHTRVWYWAK